MMLVILIQSSACHVFKQSYKEERQSISKAMSRLCMSTLFVANFKATFVRAVLIPSDLVT